MTTRERRLDARFPVTRPVKVQCAETGRYLGGATDNVSASGALLQVSTPSLLVPGQRLRVGIAWMHGQAVIESGSLADATVVRSFGIGGEQRVAVRFDHKQTLAATG